MTPAEKRLHLTLKESERRKHPNYPEHLSMPVKIPGKLDTANGMTKAVVYFIKAHNLNAERVNTMGIPVDDRKIVTDTVGFQRMIGSIGYRPTTARKGSADIHASIPLIGSNGFAVSCKFEIKTVHDRVSPDQVSYGEEVKRSGGVYVVIRSFEQFLEWWDGNVDIERIGMI